MGGPGTQAMPWLRRDLCTPGRDLCALSGGQIYECVLSLGAPTKPRSRCPAVALKQSRLLLSLWALRGEVSLDKEIGENSSLSLL